MDSCFRPNDQAVAASRGMITGSPWKASSGGFARVSVAGSAEQFGPWHSGWGRHHRWSTDGTYDAMFAAVQNESEPADRELVELVAVDSTRVRAHQHAAGAPHDQHTGPRRVTRLWPLSPPIMP